MFVIFRSSVHAASAIGNIQSRSKENFTPTFKIEYAWLSDHDGGYIAQFKIPVHVEIPSWKIALLFNERIYNITLWQATFLELSPDGQVVYCKQTKWNGHQWPGDVLNQRFLLLFNVTPGIDYNGYSGPKPDIVFLDKVFRPKRDIDYEHNMTTEDYEMYSKPKSIYFRKPVVATVPVTTTKPTTTTLPTTTQYNPFANTGQEKVYEEHFGQERWWFVNGYNRSNVQTTTTKPTTTTPLASWWRFAHKTSTPLPKPTPADIDCNNYQKKRIQICKDKKKPRDRCFVPQCEDQRFKAMQCAVHTKRCWCVDVRSGARKGELVRMKNSQKLNCHIGDQSRTTTVTSTVSSYVFTTTTPYIPKALKNHKLTTRPIFAPRNTYDYAKVIHNSHLFFEAQRSGKLPTNKRIYWRSTAHTKDGSECGKDLSGGYYQSGDYIKFGFPTAFAITQLAWSYLEAKDAYKAAWQTKFLQDTLEWATDYFIKAHTARYEFFGQVGDPIYEEDTWSRPQDMTGIRRPCYRITSRSPGSDLAAETAAALAATAAVKIENGVKQNDGNLKSLIRHAKELFQFAEKFRGVYHVSIRAAANYYPSSGYEDELAWAALWLYIATGEEQYLANAKTKYFKFSLFKQETEFSWDRKGVGVQLLLAKYTNSRTYFNPVVKFCDSVMSDGTTQYTPQGLLFISKWGPIRYACNAAFICMMASKYKYLSDQKRLKYRKFGEDQIDYVLGKTGRSFVIGYGAKYPTQPHHRASSCSLVGSCTRKDYRSKTKNPQVLVGAVVGGPDERDVWTNDRSNIMTNSVSLDFNSALQSSIAVLRQFQIEYKAWFESQIRKNGD